MRYSCRKERTGLGKCNNKQPITRHLGLPGDLAGTREATQFIAAELPADSCVNVVAQYRPMSHTMEVAGKDPAYRELRRRITAQEYRQAVGITREAGLYRGFL